MRDSLPSAEEVLGGLRLFQRRTATYAFRRLFDPDRPTPRFLVADEVGLGKTLVARGVIAQVVEHLRRLGDRRTDIVYICSNGAIARQNLRKLNIAGEDAIVEADRFTMLTNELHKLESRRLNLVAVTPGTSLDLGYSAGHFSERALLYAVLQRIWGPEAMQGQGRERVFYLGIRDDSDAGRRLREAAATMTPSATVVRRFREELHHLNLARRGRGLATMRVEFNRLSRTFQDRDGFTPADRERRNGFIGELRRALATVGIRALQPDLVILDEFQRFRTLMDPDNPDRAARLARELFEYREPIAGRQTRTLLLSATPYRPYTTADDEAGDTHFDDFIQTARFLLGDDLASEALRDDLRELRRSLLHLGRDGGEAARQICERVARRLRPVMARTERLASTPDRDGMLAPIPSRLELHPSDVGSFLAAARAARLLGHADITEYWRSSPFLLNFMEGYALKHAFQDAASGQPPEELVSLVRGGQGLLDWGEVRRYGRIDPANARLRALSRDVIDRGVWRLLWLPPSLPYYDAGGPFDEAQARSFTKRLVFSSWHVVPKVVSAMLSHEAEREIFRAEGELEGRPYEEFGDRPDRLLDFRLQAETGRLDGMPNLLWVTPFVQLARRVDPLGLRGELAQGSAPPRLEEVERAAREVIARSIEPVVARHQASETVDARWYWAGPLLLDHSQDPQATERWWARAEPSLWTRDEEDDHGSSRFARHLKAARRLLAERDSEPLGRPPDDLVEVLTQVALGGPAVCALRSLSRLGGWGISHDPRLTRAAGRIAWGFRSLLSGPDATAVVRAASPRAEAFWRAALAYAVSGHLQAVLDEYVHVLRDWRGFLERRDAAMLEDLAETAFSALSLRTVNYAADIVGARGDRIAVDRHTMRGRFAIRFGDQAMEGERHQRRAQQASHAFNSPFWPFVMTTTSVGQEGLDFHLYSHAVVHWNLPGNPVDFEQREGRVHRYKGHAVRKNVAHRCHPAANRGLADPWESMFAEAATLATRADELEPCWVFSPPGAPARIERHVLVLPFSRDAGRLERLLADVATYRLSFGQPRQEELIRCLSARVPAEALGGLAEALRVDLTPPP